MSGLLWIVFACAFVGGAAWLYLVRYKKVYLMARTKARKELKRAAAAIEKFTQDHPDRNAVRYNPNLRDRRNELAAKQKAAKGTWERLRNGLHKWIIAWAILCVILLCAAIFV